ncbi:MAG: hypothetical protein WCB12_14105 [Bryobacteraceae bacterium]
MSSGANSITAAAAGPVPVAPADQIQHFLDALFGQKDDSEYILIWLSVGLRSAWFKTTAEAAAYVRANSDKDIYVGVALSPADHGRALRLKIDGNERIPSSVSALWADLDIVGAHKKTNLPPTVEDAKTILFSEMPPSILVHSGGGLQAWWRFKEPWRLDTPEEVAKAAALSVRWNRALRARAAVKGWDLDSVGDLTRVMRVAGTTNWKVPGQPRPAELLDLNNHRYEPSDLDGYLDLIGAELPAERPEVVVGKLNYRADAEPPRTKFDLLCETDHKFALTWKRGRKDMKDRSSSGYDMALANAAAFAGWSDQEIVDLLIANKRRLNQDLKLRDSYYVTTIKKARAAHAEELAAVDRLVAMSRSDCPWGI